MSNYTLRLFLHQVPIWHLPLAFIMVHVMIYLYISWFRQSVLSMLAFALIPYFLYKLVRPSASSVNSQQQQCELMTEDSCKSLYVYLYVTLNKITEYLRSIIQLKGNMKAVGKVALFMYGSLLLGKVGDKMIVYLAILGLFLYTPVMKRIGGGAGGVNKEEDDK
jgi:hypothetical protein